jgi:hypothetical protein
MFHVNLESTTKISKMEVNNIPIGYQNESEHKRLNYHGLIN